MWLYQSDSFVGENTTMNTSAACHEIDGCRGCYVDAFRGRYLKQLTKDSRNIFVLTHYHGDHYGSLPREFKYQGPAVIHCTPVTAELLRRVHKVSHSLIQEHEYGETWTYQPNLTEKEIGVRYKRTCEDDRCLTFNPCTHVDSCRCCKITFYNANHCPGAALVIFELPDGRVNVHTGDMRYCPSMILYRILQQAAMQNKVDTVWLDTTYSDPKHDFVQQQVAIDTIASQIEEIFQDQSRLETLVLLSCYSIGKERVLWEASQRTNQMIYVQEKKHRMLQCIQDKRGLEHHASCNIIERCTLDPALSDVHVIPMGLAGEIWPYFQPNYHACANYAREQSKLYKKVVAFIPTGWSDATNWNKKMGTTNKRCAEIQVEIRLVAYSEHSSYSELQEFVKFLNPRKIIATVGKNEKELRKIEARFPVDIRRAKAKFIESMSSPVGDDTASSLVNAGNEIQFTKAKRKNQSSNMEKEVKKPFKSNQQQNRITMYFRHN